MDPLSGFAGSASLQTKRLDLSLSEIINKEHPLLMKRVFLFYQERGDLALSIYARDFFAGNFDPAGGVARVMAQCVVVLHQ